MKGTKRKVKAIDLLVTQYPDIERSTLLTYIATKSVSIDGEGIRDSMQTFPETSICSIHIDKFVSRGGLKLEHALNEWNIEVKDLEFIDAGSSSGGFSDCLLQRGATKVHCVDVGYNQLDYRLRVQERVVVHEKTNIMHMSPSDVEVDAAVADLSFRSITGAASHILSLTRQKWMISLIKPQFEVVGAKEDFTGVITDTTLLYDTLIAVYRSLKEEGVSIHDITNSPITGRKGNREFLALLRLSQGLSQEQFEKKAKNLVENTS